jgi:iron complex transport system ATP-binding protein
MISVKELTINYGDTSVISDFSAEIPTGKITAITGRNGAGKSTLLAAIAGELSIAAGSIEINGQAISETPKKDLSKLLSLAQQSHNYWMAYSVREIMWLGHESVSQARCDELVDALAIGEFLDQSVTTLSGGQLQRVEIARSLMRELPLVLLDEPFASQDLKSIAAITELIQREKNSGKTFVIVTHARDEDLSWCDQIINLDLR